MNRERENELFGSAELRGFKNGFIFKDEEFVIALQNEIDLEITMRFLKEIGYSKEQISHILIGPEKDAEIEDYCKKDMVSIAEAALAPFRTFIIEESFNEINRSSRRHPNMNFEKTRYRRHKKGEKYYGKTY